MYINNSILKLTYCAILLLTTAGCSGLSKVETLDSSAVSKEIKVERDAFKNTISYRGPVVSNSADNDSDAPEVEEINLHARKEQNHTTLYFLSVTDYYHGDWRGFDQAFDIAGSKFHTLTSKHNVNCYFFCGYDEVLDIELSRDYLDKHAKTGITMRLYGASGVASAPFTLSASYIEGFLKGLKSN